MENPDQFRNSSAYSAVIPASSAVIKIALLCFLLIPINLYPQELKLSEAIVTIAEELASDDSDPDAAALYIERLHELSENPVNLNSATEDEISRLFFLSDFQVKALVDYSHASGRIISVYEIINIPGFDKETAEMMIPFITLDYELKERKQPGKWNNTSLTNVSFKPGSTDTSDLGSPVRILSKYKFSSGGFSGGITFEKDPGEKFFSGNPPRPDFISSCLSYNNNTGIIRKIIIGDFSARFGQGTNVNTGIRTGISLTAPGYMPARNEIRQYTSSDENNFFRGMAAELSLKSLSLSLFYSVNHLDAVQTSGDDHIENLYLSGLHNTSSLLLRKDVVTDYASGINLSYNFKNARAGLAWTEDRLSLPLIKDETGVEDLFDFSGDRNSAYSFYYNCLVRKILLFGEVSLNESLSHAIVQGLTIRMSDRLAVNWLFRNYEPGYFSLHGKGPGGSSGNSNEMSILGNFTFEAAKHLFISGGCDIRHFPWLKYRSSAPSNSVRQEARIKFLPSDNLSVEVLYNYRLSMNDNAEDTGIPSQNELSTNYIRCSARYSPSERLILGTRMDYKAADPSGKGMLLLQDAVFTFRKIPLTCWFRYCLFNTGSWDSRLYTYENDLLYSFSIPALSGEGSRSYFMIKYEIGDVAEIRFKYGITSIAEAASFKNSEEIKFQLKINF